VHGSSLLDAYLARLGCGSLADAAPSVSGLRHLHRGHVEHVAYETVDLVAGRPPGIEPRESAERIVSGRGGYCYQLNGAFSWLLRELGYDAVRHVAGVSYSSAQSTGADGNHLGLTVRGMPDAQSPDGVWLVDVALGDALYEPMPLRWGEYPQGPFTYRLAPSPTERGGWRLEHAPGGSFAVVDVAAPTVDLDAFAEQHRYLSSDPASPYVRVLTAQRRVVDGVDILRGRVLTRWDAAGTAARELDAQQWWDVLTDRFELVLDEADRAPLWQRVSADHEAWLAARRPV
jgi:N-hydroxyarylamine O-acetyltransferase